ncbi:MAG: DUF4185 domain-containing protein [Bacteroidales bacterium]|nr:DUF4185 domain-containing protein [Bacteroidales bacterium]
MKTYIQTFFILLLLVGCKTKQSNETKSDNLSDSITSFSVTESPEWESVFYRNSGWFGGDGIFAVNLDGKEDFEQKDPNIMLWFGDTMYGNIVNNVLQPDFTMTHNSFAITNKNTPDSNAITFYADYRDNNKPKTILIPNSPDTGEGEYYWMGDGFVNQAKNNDLYIFGYRIKNVSNEAFGFKEMGNNLVVIPSGQKPPFENIRQLDIPFFKGMKIDSVGTFGCAILVNTKEAGVNKGDGYIYIYGIRGMEKAIYVARVNPADIESFDKWTFWNGNAFSTKPSEIKPLITGASNELSVSSLPNGKYIFVYQRGFNGKICFQLADSPVGTFKAPIEIYDPALKFKDNKNIFTYNAKALPVLSKEGELVISYNVNSLKFFEEDLKKDPHLYRPRFITLKYTLK